MAPPSIKTSLLLIAQLKLALGMAVAPRGVTCNYETAASSGDTCTSFAADWGLTLATFESLNPTAACPSLVAGQSYCVVGTATADATTTSPTSSTSSTTSKTSTSSSSSTSTVSVTTTSSAPYQPQETGTAATCNEFYLVESGDSCVIIEDKFGITSAEFLAWNPSINSGCTNILAGYYYCVDIPGTTKVTTTTTAATTTVPADGITTPTPIQTGMTTTCNKFQLVVSGDTCAAIATTNDISLANFYAWNPAVGSSCATLGLGYYVCVDIIGNTATATTTTSAGNGITTPTPFEPGMVSDCNKFYFVVSGDTCSGIATSQGVTVAEIELWNPQVGTACTDIWLGDYICVGV